MNYEKQQRKTPCDVTIAPFDCTKKTCECDPPQNLDETVSENYLVRFDGRSQGGLPDKQRINIKNTLNCQGRLLLERGGQQLSDTSINCTTVWQCLTAIDAATVNRPPIEMEDGTGSMSVDEAFMRFQGWGHPSNPVPKVQPFTKREKFKATVTCCSDPDCSESIDVTGWDCDLILLAYQMVYVASMSTAGIVTGVLTV